MKSLRGLAFAMFVTVAMLGTNTSAQVSTALAQLNGTVRDQAGNVLVRATITLRNADTNLAYTTSSNATGYYILTNLPPGNYLLTTEATGFRRYEQTGVVLRVGQVATIDVSMKIGTVSEKIEVNSEAPIIEPTRTEVS